MKAGEFKVTEENYDIIQSYASGIIEAIGSEKWVEEGLTEDTYKVEFLKEKKVVGSLTMHDKDLIAVGDLIVKKLRELVAIKEDFDKKKLTEEKVKGTIFKNILTKSDAYNGLAESPIVWEILTKALGETSIKESIISQEFGENKSVCSDPTIIFSTTYNVSSFYDTPKDGNSKYTENLQDYLYKNYPHDALTKGEFKPVTKFLGFIRPLNKETIQEIKLKEQIIGHYLPERNLISIYFNPFLVKKVLPLDLELPKIWVDLIKILKDLKIKVVDTSLLQRKMFITTFMTGSKKRAEEVENQIKSCLSNISSYEHELRTQIQNIDSYKNEQIRLAQMIDSGGESIFKELDEVQKLSFLEKVKFESNALVLKYKPTSIIVPEWKRIDFGKPYGKRTIFLGSITVTISPSNFKFESDYPIRESHAHPHVNSGTPCFGDGPGRNQIYELLAANEFKDLATMLWFYIKTYRNSGAYIKHWELYDDRLARGLPIWDEKNNLITFGEEARLKTEEQRKDIPKSKEYEKNWEKFKYALKPII